MTVARRRRNSWPETDTEIADRDLVVTLVKRVGQHRLVFTTDDLRDELKEISARISVHFEGGADAGRASPSGSGEKSGQLVGPRLHHSGDLWRHLAALEGDLIHEVARRDFGQSVPAGSYRGRKKYVLRSRVVELPAEGASYDAELDDLERCHIAAWVAFRVNGSEPATEEVTRVLRTIDPLSLTKPTQTHSLLQALAGRTPPVVEKVPVAGERWVRWRPLGDEPVHGEFDAWVEEYRRADARGASASGKATVNEIGRELVRLTVRSLKSTTYRLGRAVRLPDVRAFAGEDEDGKCLAQSIRRRSRGISAVISDAARETIGGAARVETRIARIVGPLSGNVYYDVPDEPGFDQRVRIVALQDLRSALQAGVLEAIDEDVRSASDLVDDYGIATDALTTLVAARALLAQQEFGKLDDLLSDIERHVGEFSEPIRSEIREHRARLNELLAGGIWDGDEEEVFENACRASGLDPAAVLSAERPLVTPDEYASWFSPDDLGGYTAAEFMWLAVPLRRFMNPHYTHRRDTDRQRAFRFTTDRVEALPYAANRLMAQSSAALAAGARLLGRNLRSPVVLRSLASLPDPALRRDALAAMVLIRANVVELAEPLLADKSTPADLLAETIMLLHFDELWEPASLPSWIRSSRNWTIAAALREVMLARAQGRRIV